MAKSSKRKNALNQELSESGFDLPVTQKDRDKALKQRAEDENDLETANVGGEQKEVIESRESFYIDPKKQKALDKEKLKINEAENIKDLQPSETGEQIIFITGAKILKDKPVEIIFIERKIDNDEGEITYKNAALPHKDFIAAFDTLKIHIGVISGLIKSTDVKAPAKITKAIIEPFKVTGFKIKGGEDKEGFSLSGGCNGKYGWTGLNAPMVRNVNDPEDGYIFIKELSKAIEKCQAEALAYRMGKHAPKAQTEMFTAGEAE